SPSGARSGRRRDRRAEVRGEALKRRRQNARIEGPAADVPRRGLGRHLDVLEGASPLLDAAEHDRVRQVLGKNVLAFGETLALLLGDFHVLAKAQRSAEELRTRGGLRGHDPSDSQRDQADDDDGDSDQSGAEGSAKEPRDSDARDDHEHAYSRVSLPNAIGSCREPFAIRRVPIELAFRAPQRGDEMRPQLGDLHVGAVLEEALVDDALVWKEPNRVLAGGVQRPILLCQEPRLRFLGDRQVSANGKIDDRRRNVFGVRALVEDDAKLRGTDLVGRLVIGNDRLALTDVAPDRVPAPVEEREYGSERERGEREPERLRLEIAEEVVAVAGDDR